MRQFPHWRAGSQIVYREVWRGQVWTARPVTVVKDTPDLIALYFCTGTRWKLPHGNKDQFLGFLQTGNWQLTDITTAVDTLFLIQPGEAHAVHVMWGPANREFVGWYINLQETLRRTAIGFDFMDQVLDIVVKPDLSEWHWKDEAELQQAQELGLYSEQQVGEIKAAGERVIERVGAKAAPFNDGWENWFPPAEWPIPGFPEGWEKL